jgi:hypothetical protein
MKTTLLFIGILAFCINICNGQNEEILTKTVGFQKMVKDLKLGYFPQLSKEESISVREAFSVLAADKTSDWFLIYKQSLEKAVPNVIVETSISKEVDGETVTLFQPCGPYSHFLTIRESGTKDRTKSMCELAWPVSKSEKN